jgi:hypothetical protein
MISAAMLRIRAVEMAGFQQERIARVDGDGQSKKLIEGIKEIYSAGDSGHAEELFSARSDVISHSVRIRAGMSTTGQRAPPHYL